MVTRAKSWKLVKVNPVQEVKFLTEEMNDVTILLPEKDEELPGELTPQHAKDMVQFALRSGMGEGEIFNLLKEKVD